MNRRLHYRLHIEKRLCTNHTVLRVAVHDVIQLQAVH